MTASLASAVAPTSDTGMTPYERYVAVMTQLYEKKSISDNSHMMKLLQITHEVRRTKINSSTYLHWLLKKNIHSLGTKNGYVCISSILVIS